MMKTRGNYNIFWYIIMPDLEKGFDSSWKEYGVKHGIDTTLQCVEHAIRASVILGEVKKPKVFDWKRYIKYYPDLQGAFKGQYNNINHLTCHYLNHGRRESRVAYVLGSNEKYVYDFDWKTYNKLNPDVFTQHERGDIVGEWHAFRHWCGVGHIQGRPTGGENGILVKGDASISTDEKVNERWRDALSNIIQSGHKTVDELIHQLTTTSLYKIHNVCKNVERIVICSHSNLSHTAGDTIMLSNWMNHMMDYNIHVTLLSKYSIPTSFVRNLVSKSYTLIQCKDNDDLIIKMNELQNKNDRFFIRNHEILDKLRTSSFLHKICFYGLDIHLDGIALMQNRFHSIITQSEQLKTKYVEKGVLTDKIDVIEPLTYKYDFKLPERYDNEIRLIYCGTLRDEENILEIIEEFQKIHKERPEVVLKIVYGKINGNVEFTKKVNEYIKNGVDGIIFKHNLSHKDSCYEIATSDIGICWRKPGYGDNGEVSTKVKEYFIYNKMYLPFIPKYNELNYDFLLKLKIYDEQVFLFFYEIITIYKDKIHYIPYVLHNGMPYDNGGYAVRSHSIINTFNNMYSDKIYIGVHKLDYPYLINPSPIVEKYVNKIDNVYYITLPYTRGTCYNQILGFLTSLFHIKTFHVASAFTNAKPIIDFCNIHKLKSIYEVRGMWQLTGISRILYYRKYNVNQQKLNGLYTITKYNNILNNELTCIKTCTTVLYITDELVLYSKNGLEINSLNGLNINNLLKNNMIIEQPIFYNCNKSLIVFSKKHKGLIRKYFRMKA